MGARVEAGQLRRPGGEVAPAAGGTLGWVATDTLTVLLHNGHYQRSDFSPRETYTCMSRVASAYAPPLDPRGTLFPCGRPTDDAKGALEGTFSPTHPHLDVTSEQCMYEVPVVVTLLTEWHHHCVTLSSKQLSTYIQQSLCTT